MSDETWRRLLDPDHVVQGFGAVLDGHLVGIVHYLFHPVTWSTGPRCYLEDLFTSKDARGQGVGRALIAAVHREAQKAGADQVYWLTESHNRRAQALYDKVATKTPFIKYAQVL
ncbi:MAG TPA: GNAT family N-acetyltransferase [Hellea balneolensis]|uniref:GNAT family N-acetyltransferase n=1 Tax=Hellea balneolensis TaxID=287478 RepID=A0A7C5M0U1_9PROT|nr:GNAT family N-acetyltransferase [Hellea balneolensis]